LACHQSRYRSDWGLRRDEAQTLEIVAFGLLHGLSSLGEGHLLGVTSHAKTAVAKRHQRRCLEKQVAVQGFVRFYQEVCVVQDIQEYVSWAREVGCGQKLVLRQVLAHLRATSGVPQVPEMGLYGAVAGSGLALYLSHLQQPRRSFWG
jgi:hypothetical protein